MRRAAPLAFVRDWVAGTAAIGALYLLMRVPFHPTQIPGYLLVVGFDVLEATLGSTGTRYPLWFAAYLSGLGAAGAVVSRVLRTLAVRTDVSGWRVGVAGGCVVVGAGALAFALFVSARVGVVSVLLTGGTALALFAVAGLFLRFGA
ncbi:hypothetical protein [Halogeometricum pallidum]|uniref:hypothetical protein n=1 Tax=Halogeometricum pallidum TaxID=411361 RepID=UPI00126956AA|nr:hypothetical protein [Halogeometricum pallidum]